MWSISSKKKLYEVAHNDVNHVRLFSDSTLGFDLITCGFDKTVKFWRSGELVRCLEHSGGCYHFDLDETNRLLAVACGEFDRRVFSVSGKDHGTGSVVVWRLDNFTKIGEEKIGWTTLVRFNAHSTTIIAVKRFSEVYKINLE